MQESVSVTISHEPGSSEPALVCVAGELDLSNSDAVRARLDEIALVASRVILDMQNLEFIDSTGLSTIVRLEKQLKERGSQLAVIVSKPSIRKLFAITALDKRFALYDRIEAVRFSDTAAAVE